MSEYVLCTGDVSHIQVYINSSLVVDKVLVGETVVLTCYVYVPSGVGVDMRWTSDTGSQVSTPTLWLAVWCSGNALVSINAVALHRARLVLGWVTAFGQVNCLIT